MNITNKEYADYMLANYKLGYTDTAIFIAANLFEKYFKNMISKKEACEQLHKKYINLEDYIELYMNDRKKYNEDVIYSQTNDLKLTLGSFRRLRNSLIHDMSEKKLLQKKKEIGEFILYVYFSYHKEQSYDRTIIWLENESITLLQDYKIKEITERMIARMEKEKIPNNSEVVKNFKGLEEKDFDNLFELRKKLRYLQRNIEKEMLEIGLVPTILSPIDTTSAYVWMPFIDKDFTDNINKLHTQRNNLVIGSVSLLATPLDLRIYIDFGGGDFEYRMAFQDFLQTKEFLSCIEQFNNQDPQLKIFDIKWYSFITKIDNLFDKVDQYKLKGMALTAKDKILHNKDNIITFGNNRIGYVLPARNITKKEILSLFKNITYIYYEFLIYKFQDDTDLDILKQVQKNLKQEKR